MHLTDSIAHPPAPHNEPVRAYRAGSAERASLEAALAVAAGSVVEIPCVVNGAPVYTGRTVDVHAPCDHGTRLARVHLPDDGLVQEAIAGARAAAVGWAALPWEERAAVFLKAAELLAGPFRDRMNAATMLGQAKTCHQAEIDAACELIDFWRFNAYFARQILADQPPVSAPGTWNRTDHRPLEGFVFAVTPFNFTSIALNLPTAPALMGNVALWKPSITQCPSAWVGMELLAAAGLPPGVVQFLPGFGADVGAPALASPHLAGLHFTGSTATFQALWRGIGDNLPRYRAYPRIVGETGGKDFILAHPSADVDALAVAILRGAFEYQGQKCSAASRVFIPASLWPAVRARVADGVAAMKMGDTRDFGVFIGAVIDERAFERHAAALVLARDTAEVVVGGGCDRRAGWFVEPTFARVEDPKHRLLEEELFGPICAAFVYPDNGWSDILPVVDAGSPYALTGAVFAQERNAIAQATAALRQAAGNFYINDKPTGAVVGQQPFGGARASGTNDKAGSAANLQRWVSARTIKETFVPATDWRYPYLGGG